MSRIELLPEGLVILPSGTAPEPSDGESGSTTSPVFPSGAGEEVANQSPLDFGELSASVLSRTVRTSSNAWVSSRSAVRSDTGEVAWRLTTKAISHLFGSPSLPYRRVDEIQGHLVPDNVERGQVGTAKVEP